MPESHNQARKAPPDLGEGERLVQQWREGRDSEGSFKQLFDRYYRSVFSFFLRQGFACDEAYDLTQDTFVKVCQGLPTFRAESRFESWLFTIAYNVRKNELRSRSALKRDATEVPLDTLESQPAEGAMPGSCRDEQETGPLAAILSEERRQVLRKAFESLPCQMKRCVLLRIDQDLRYREIAEVLRVSIETVKAHLFQARQQLKLELADYFEDLDV